ncbi:MAG TPA: N-acetylmuramoyl-L-alanine amidase [Solirubrobacteraceae bacterium]
MPSLTRRQALRLGAGAALAGLLRSPALALAARPALFELRLGDHDSAGWRTTPVLRAPRRFDLIGLRWARGGHLEAEIRARRRGRPWTPWVALPPLADHAPDDGRMPAGTDPAFTGAADELQLRLRGSARGVRARFVRALPATPRFSPRAHAAQVGAPAIIPRSAWGADSVPPRTDPDYGVVQVAFVHHTVTANSYRPQDSAGIVLGIARFHRDSNGWNDIGYNFLVDRYGQVFEGRAGGVANAVVGAQAQGYNAQSTGVACLGTFTSVAQTEAGMDALARLIGWKLSLHGVPVQGRVTVVSAGGVTNRYRAGTPVSLQRISGHRDGDQTACPGNRLYRQLGDLRRRAARYAGPISNITVSAAGHQYGLGPSGLAGVLRFADGSSAAGVPLSVQFAPGETGAWTTLATTVCGADGAWSASVSLPSTGHVQVVLGGDATRASLASAPIAIEVVPAVTLTTSRRRVRAGRFIALRGTIAPTRGRVTCRLQRRVGRRWVTVTRRRLKVREGAFAARLRLRRRGRYRVRVSAGPGSAARLLRATR